MTARTRSGTLTGIALGAVLVSVCAQVSVPIPGSPVPQSLQTLAVVLVGVVMGPIRGAICLLLYVVLGAVGLPVFADGAAGAEHLRGPTAGYLAGFVLGAAASGLWSSVVERLSGASEGPASAWAEAGAVFAVGLLAHVVILGFGGLRLAGMIGPSLAFTTGVAPFLVGGLAKSLMDAGGWLLVRPLDPFERRPS